MKNQQLVILSSIGDFHFEFSNNCHSETELKELHESHRTEYADLKRDYHDLGTVTNCKPYNVL